MHQGVSSRHLGGICRHFKDREAASVSALEQCPSTRHTTRVKKFLPVLLLVACALLLSSCLTKPVADSGGGGAVTVQNTNVTALTATMNAIFPQYGYTPGPTNFPASISFDKPAGTFGKLMYGSYGVTNTVRVQVSMVSLGGNNYRLIPRVSRVTDAGQAGFEEDNKMLGAWSGQFAPILKKVQAQATGAGPGY